MLNEFLRRLYFKIRLAQCSTTLESLEETYVQSTMSTWLSKLKNLTTELEGLWIFNTSHNFNTANTEVVKAMRSALASEDFETLHKSLPEIKRIIDSSYQSLTFRPKWFTNKRILGGLIIFLIVILLIAVYKPMKERYFLERTEYQLQANEDLWKEQTINDIQLLKQALASYHADNNAYPKSSGGWDAVVAAYGVSRADWVPGLVPKYLKELPVDPRKSNESENQYMYKSDGTDFKLIAHKPLGMDEAIKKFPELIDPVRPSWAFGIWSEGAKNW